MPITVLVALGRARVALMVAGLAWFVGLDTGWPARLILAGLVAVATAFDALISDHTGVALHKIKAPPGRDNYRPTA
jgi:hypothetical protein